MSLLLKVIAMEAEAQWIAEPYVQRKGVPKAEHLTTVRHFVKAIRTL